MRGFSGAPFNPGIRKPPSLPIRWQLSELSEHDRRLAAGSDAIDGIVGGQVFCAVVVAAFEHLLSDFLLMVSSLSDAILHFCLLYLLFSLTRTAPVTGNNSR